MAAHDLACGGPLQAACVSPLSDLSVAQWHEPGETLIFLDWDDTLCPSTWITDDDRLHWNKPCPAFADPSMPLKPPGACLDPGREDVRMVDALRRHEEALAIFLRVAAVLGQVIIVTLAVPGWVDTSIKNFLPGLAQTMEELKIQVVYARESVPARQVRYAMGDGIDIWCLLKTAAMKRAAKRFYSQRLRQSWKNCLSIGDSLAERDGLVEAIFARSQPDLNGQEKPVRCKTVLLPQEPDLEQLSQELEVLSSWLALLVHYDGDVEIDLQSSDGDNNVAFAVRELLETPTQAPLGSSNYVPRSPSAEQWQRIREAAALSRRPVPREIEEASSRHVSRESPVPGLRMR